MTEKPETRARVIGREERLHPGGAGERAIAVQMHAPLSSRIHQLAPITSWTWTYISDSRSLGPPSEICPGTSHSSRRRHGGLHSKRTSSATRSRRTHPGSRGMASVRGATLQAIGSSSNGFGTDGRTDLPSYEAFVHGATPRGSIEDFKHIDPDTYFFEDRPQIYKLMIGGIVPRPIALCSTVSPQGRRNLAPFSFSAPIGFRPPMVRSTSSDSTSTLIQRLAFAGHGALLVQRTADAREARVQGQHR